MTFDAPFKLGPFSIDAEGRLSPCEPAAAPVFLFRCHDRVVRARLDQAGPEAGQLILQMTLARVRSSASTSDATLRPRSFALLHWLARMVPQAWRVALLADHRVWLMAYTYAATALICAGDIGVLPIGIIGPGYGGVGLGIPSVTRCCMNA